MSCRRWKLAIKSWCDFFWRLLESCRYVEIGIFSADRESTRQQTPCFHSAVCWHQRERKQQVAVSAYGVEAGETARDTYSRTLKTCSTDIRLRFSSCCRKKQSVCCWQQCVLTDSTGMTIRPVNHCSVGYWPVNHYCESEYYLPSVSELPVLW